MYRQVNQHYREHYDLLVSSGLYQHLCDAGLLIPHQEIGLDYAQSGEAYRVLQPDVIPFVSYPYEWCFSQLKDAALATLAIQKRALRSGMTLKDASAYNIQFLNGKPVLIDSLSFEKYEEGRPWIAYRQFCQHFLAPLALMAYRDVRLSQLLRVHLDGIPLDLASQLLPRRSYVNLGLALHIHVHARGQRAFKNTNASGTTRRQMSRQALTNLVDNLISTVQGLTWQPAGGDWNWTDYYQGDSYTQAGFEHKQALVRQYLAQTDPKTVWDLGANTGVFSRIAREQGAFTVACDVDPGAVEMNYRRMVERGESNLHPLLIDLTNPSPALGWANRERDSLHDRGQPDMLLALALVHHLAISNNVPLPHIAAEFARLGQWLIIEFVPKSDKKVQQLLAAREDIFPHYTREGFEAAFAACFDLLDTQSITDSDRLLYLMKVKTDA